jgi:hypothetical protein
MLLNEILARLDALPPEQLKELHAARAKEAPVWLPTAGPQLDGYQSQADELFYGGSAGGGKTDLIVGLSLTQHSRSLILRRTNKEASKLVERYVEVLGHRNGWNGQQQVWHLPDGKVIDIGGVQHEDDKQKYKGTPHDLIAWDEVSDFTETQFRFINTWNRSANPKQRCRIVCAGNPPTRPEGLWVLKYWAPWLDKNHPNPAKPGELRWFTTVDGQDCEVEGRGPHNIDGEMVEARSRTFVPARLEDNPDLARTNYAAVLAALPEELRAAYKDGRFDVGLKDDDWQCIPTAWIEAAMQRWTPTVPDGVPMTAIAVDVAPGGGDQRVIAPRHGGYYPKLDVAREVDKDGRLTASAVVKIRRNNCPVVVDLGGGWGGDTTIALKDNGIEVVAYMGLAPSAATTRDGKLRFYNTRAADIWKFREALDPGQEGGSAIALPPDPELKADLASFRWELTPQGIKVEPKEKIKDRIGRSPDKGEAVVMCLAPGDKAVRRALTRGSPPRVQMAYANSKRNYHVGRR